MKRKLMFVLAYGVMLLFPSLAEENSAPGEYAETLHDEEGITVTGTRTQKRLKDSPALTEVITGEEIAASGASTLNDVFGDYGIMYRSSAMGDFVMLQGMDAGRVLYLVNGRRVAGRTGQRLNTRTIAAGDIERVEIVRGPQSALYGSEGMGGVINIITAEPEGDFSFSASLRNTLLFAHDDSGTAEDEGENFWGGIAPLREQTASFRAGFGTGPLRNSFALESGRGAAYGRETVTASDGKPTVSAVLPEYYRYGGGLDSAVSLPVGGELRFGGSFLTMRTDAITFTSGNIGRNDYFRGGGYVEADFSPLADTAFTLKLYDTLYLRDQDEYTAAKNSWRSEKEPREETENLAVFEALGAYSGIPGLLFSGGVEAAYNSMEHYDFTGAVAVDREALFLQAEWFRAGRHSLLGGVRLERNSQFGFTAAPKLSGMLHLGEHFRVLGGAGMGYRAPSFNELYRDYRSSATAKRRYHILPNPDLKPEYSLSFNTGLEYSRGNTYFQMNAYYTELFDEIDTNTNTGRKDTVGGKDYHLEWRENIARSLRTGADLEGRVYFLKYGFASAGYSFIFAWNRGAGEEMHEQPPHGARASIGIDHRPRGIHAYLQGRFFSPRGDDVYDEGEYRFILDFNCTVALGKNVRLHVSLDNITGARYYYGPATGRSLTAALNISG